MSIANIAAMKTSVTEIPVDCRGVHESCLRAYHIVLKVKDYLRRGVPTDVLLELIEEMEYVEPPESVL